MNNGSELHSRIEVDLTVPHHERRHKERRVKSRFSIDLEECSHRLPAERLFFQLYIGTEVKTLHDTSRQRVKKCDAGTYVVLSGDTTMLSSCQRNRQCQLKG